MNNDLKNFLEKKYKEQEAQYETSTFINWLKESDKELVNFVLDLVEKDVYKKLLEKARKTDYADRTEYDEANEIVSTIINNLRV